MNVKNIQFFQKNRINNVLNLLLTFVELAMMASILIFLFLVLKGYLYLGHIPSYGDKEVISFNGLDRIIVKVMLYLMSLGYILWLSCMFCGLLSGLERKRKFVIIGFVLCFLNVLAMFSSQFAWVLD